MILKVESLTKQYGGLIAVNNVSFEIKKGIIFSIIGPNGAGKTTLFNLISGTQASTAGSIVFEGEDIVKIPAHIISNRGIRRTFQTTTVFRGLTVQENLIIGYIQKTKNNYLGSLLHTKQWKSDKLNAEQKAVDIAEILDMRSDLNLRAGMLSQEKQKKLAIGIALMSDPTILLLDEPTGGLIQEDTNRIIALIRRIKDQGITVCLVEHKMNMIMNLADEILVLNFGKKIAQGPPEMISKDPEVIRAYLGREYHAT